MKKKKQIAALTYQIHDEGNVRVLLVTTRGTGRWIIPKGWPMKSRKPHRAAAIEAFEEAGAVGKTDKQSIGIYEYEKRLEDGSKVPCNVTVFPLPVKRLHDEWPEAGHRVRQWFEPEEAAALVKEPDLAQILRSWNSRCRRRVTTQ